MCVLHQEVLNVGLVRIKRRIDLIALTFISACRFFGYAVWERILRLLIRRWIIWSLTGLRLTQRYWPSQLVCHGHPIHATSPCRSTVVPTTCTTQHKAFHVSNRGSYGTVCVYHAAALPRNDRLVGARENIDARVRFWLLMRIVDSRLTCRTDTPNTTHTHTNASWRRNDVRDLARARSSGRTFGMGAGRGLRKLLRLVGGEGRGRCLDLGLSGLLLVLFHYIISL